MEDKISSIVSAAEDAIMTLKNECKRQLMLLPTKVRRAAAAARVCEAVWWGGRLSRTGLGFVCCP